MKALQWNYLEAIFTFLFMQNRKPSYLIFFSTNKCEAACRHCFYWAEANHEMSMLSKEEIDLLAKKLGPVMQVTITGGSPELREDLYDIIRSFATHCDPINITLCSNGNYPEVLYRTVNLLLKDFKELPLTVDISLDGLYEEHDSIRQIDGLFNKVLRSYSLLNELKKTYPGLRLGCGLVVSGFNKDTAVQTAKWALENLPIDNFTPVMVRGNTRENEALNVSPEVFKTISDEVRGFLKNGNLRGYTHFTRIINAKDIVQKELIYRIRKEKNHIVECSAMHETAVVYPSGTVGLCELREEQAGNLKDYDMDLKKIWRSDKAKSLREIVRAEECFCWHQCFLSAPVIKSPAMWGKLIRTYLSL
jgi:MoaA/NifB/PqqE/SkfB family radical SAM enzyme